MLGGGQEVGELLQSHIGLSFRSRSQSSLQRWLTRSDTEGMIISHRTRVTAAVGAFGALA